MRTKYFTINFGRTIWRFKNGRIKFTSKLLKGIWKPSLVQDVSSFYSDQRLTRDEARKMVPAAFR